MQNENAAGKDAVTLTIIFAIIVILTAYFADSFSLLFRTFIISHTFACLAAARIGKERRIGFTKAFFITFVTSILVGFVIIFNSPRIRDEEYKEKMLELTGSRAPATSVADELAKLNELKKEGVITEEEFVAQKAKLLG